MFLPVFVLHTFVFKSLTELLDIEEAGTTHHILLQGVVDELELFLKHTVGSNKRALVVSSPLWEGWRVRTDTAQGLVVDFDT